MNKSRRSFFLKNFYHQGPEDQQGDSGAPPATLAEGTTEAVSESVASDDANGGEAGSGS